jgi:homoserine dehydrogenase
MHPMPRVAFLGAGTVGAAAIRRLQDVPGLEVSAALVRDLDAPRDLGPRPPRLTTDADEVIAGADVVVDVMGGVEVATELMARAGANGARLVSANKAALAERWDVWGPLIRAGRVGFEAAVMAGTPVVGPLAGALRGSRPIALHALLNGTCAYLIERLEAGTTFDAALAEAQRLGYAEADPALDVDGVDAAHKLTLLARMCALPDLAWDEARRDVRGVRGLTPALVAEVGARGARVRLVASLWCDGARWRVAVRPVALPVDHPLVLAGSGKNALLYRGDAVGEVVISGPGAGAEATASGVVADVLDAVAGRPGPLPPARAEPAPAVASGADDFETIEIA